MGFDMIPHQFTFLFQSQAFLLTLFSRDPNILRPFHGLSAKQRNPIRGRPKQGCITSTWRLLFIANLPNSCFSCWFISLSGETCLTNSCSSKLAMWTGLRSDSTQQTTTFDRQTLWIPPSQMTSFLWFCPMQSKSACIFVGGEWARLRSRAAVLGPWWAPCAQSGCFRRVFQQ